VIHDEEGCFSIDCGEPATAKLVDVADMQVFLSESLQPRQVVRSANSETQPPKQPASSPEMPPVIRCGASTPRYGIGGLVTPRASPRMLERRRAVHNSPRQGKNSPRSTPRHATKATTPRRNNKQAAKQSARATVPKSGDAELVWHFVTVGARIDVAVPTMQACNGRRLVESMLRRYLQRQSLLSRVEMRRATSGGIVLRVDTQDALRQLEQMNAEDANDPEGLDAPWTNSWGSSVNVSDGSRHVPKAVNPLRLDSLQSIHDEVDTITVHAAPRGPWFEGALHPHEVEELPPYETTPTNLVGRSLYEV